MSLASIDIEVLLLARAYCYEMLHKAFGGRPSEGLLEAMACEGSLGALGEFAESGDAVTALVEELSDLNEDKRRDRVGQLEGEYARLFVGPGSLPALPWESTHVSKEPLLFQQSTLLVRAAYREQGLQMRKFKNVPEDHLSTMCSFMAQVGRRLLAAMRDGRLDEAGTLAFSSSEFLDEHLLAWVPEYASELAEKAEYATFYPLLAKAAVEFLRCDSNLLQNLLVWLAEQKDGGQTAMDEGDERVAADGSDKRAAAGGQALDAADAMRLVGLLEQSYAQLEAVCLFGLEDNELEVVEEG